jgi:hypothetical protein
VDTQTVDGDITFLTYERVRAAERASGGADLRDSALGNA